MVRIGSNDPRRRGAGGFAHQRLHKVDFELGLLTVLGDHVGDLARPDRTDVPPVDREVDPDGFKVRHGEHG